MVPCSVARQPRIALFFALSALLAFCFTAVETYVLARAAELGASTSLMGVMQVVMTSFLTYLLYLPLTYLV